MSTYAILADNFYCTGCHACELACKNEKELPSGQWGIKVLELGPWKREDDIHWEYRYVPVLTASCDLCAARVRESGQPSCVFHCPASALEYGTLEDLSKSMAEKGKMAMILLP